MDSYKAQNISAKLYNSILVVKYQKKADNT